MTQYIPKEPLLAEMKRRILEDYNTEDEEKDAVAQGAIASLKYYIENTLEVKEVKEEPVSEDLEEASKEWLRPQLDMSYINYGEGKMMELTHFNGYAMLDAIEFGAKWKEEQMMKGAVDAEVTYGKSIAIPSLGYFLDKNEMGVGDKVKLILIKSE